MGSQRKDELNVFFKQEILNWFSKKNNLTGLSKKDKLNGFSKTAQVEGVLKKGTSWNGFQKKEDKLSVSQLKLEAAVSAGWSPGCWGEGGRQTCTWNKTGGNTQRQALKCTKLFARMRKQETTQREQIHNYQKAVTISVFCLESVKANRQTYENKLRVAQSLIWKSKSSIHVENVLAPKVGKFETFKSWGRVWQLHGSHCAETVRRGLDPPRLQSEPRLDPPRLQFAPEFSGRALAIASWIQDFSNSFQATGKAAETPALTDSFEWKIQDFILVQDLKLQIFQKKVLQFSRE